MTSLLFSLGMGILCLLIGGLSGALVMYTKLRPRIEAQVRKELEQEDRERRNIPDSEHRILKGQVWWHPDVGRCVLSGVYEALRDVSAEVPNPRSKFGLTKTVTLDLDDFLKRGVYLAAYDGGPEHPIPIQAQLDMDAREEMEEARAEVERASRGELDPKVKAKLEAITRNAPQGTQEERWAWATGKKKEPDLSFL